MISSISLLILSSFGLNLPLQFGLTIKEIWQERDKSGVISFFECMILFFSVLIQWILFTYIFAPLNLGFIKYFVLFPAGAAISSAFEILFGLVFPKLVKRTRKVFSFSAETGLSLAATILIISMATTLSQALILDAGFALGTYLAVVLLKAIRLRLLAEKTNPLFEGIPILLISIGLLSLFTMTIAIVCLNAKGGL
jgi:Na+-translocating ferredoxin:NAD+ oxidoreductase RnfA subunit